MSDDRKPTDGGDDELYESPDGRPVRRVPKDADGNATREYDFQEVEIPDMPPVTHVDRDHPLIGGDPFGVGNDEGDDPGEARKSSDTSAPQPA